MWWDGSETQDLLLCVFMSVCVDMHLRFCLCSVCVYVFETVRVAMPLYLCVYVCTSWVYEVTYMYIMGKEFCARGAPSLGLSQSTF